MNSERITAMHTRFVTIYILNIIDMLATLYFTKLYGNGIEGNPLGLWLLEHKPLLFMYKVVFIGLLLAFLYKCSKRITAVCSWVLLGSFTVINVYHLILYIQIKSI
jgi:hypothetical protein